jgi:flagellar basal body-associated protein FliL
MMKKPAVLAALGAVAGVVVALGLFMFVFGGNKSAQAVPIAAPTVVNVPGKLGPHITLADRIFNLQSKTPVYLKLQTLIEFETTDPRWGHALTGCAFAPGAGGTLYVSAAPLAVGAPAIAPASGGSTATSPCEAEQATLEAEFEAHIGNGVQLIEDAVTNIVTAKTPDQLATPDGKDALKAEITKAVTDLLPDEHVKRVLFVDFITQ